MPRRTVKILLGAALALTAASAVSLRPLPRLAFETRIVPPLADPALVPGVGRCTSDGVCLVVDEHGVHEGTPILAP